ncbi:MAG: hypothetical protein A2020_05410 [Lentisphaerae bacterium GWF2_45_14]|nr:MAG: hypothetical protein A2020_05410 [Lentisphaerae bacterium GWF2_45_14]
MSETLKIVFMALIQGFTEFLPVSSSGHLAISRDLLGLDPDGSLCLVVTLHAGTLVAILLYYFKELFALLKPSEFKMLFKIIVGTAPAAAVGIILHKTNVADNLFNSIYVAGAGLIITGFILRSASKTRQGMFVMREISLPKALFVGIAQAFAILPGISRSGTTITAGMKVGLKDEDAAKFSFFLAVPAIGGAAFVEVLSKFLKNDFGTSYGTGSMLLGFFVSAISGYIAIALLISLLKKNKLSFFSYYCFIIGILAISLKLTGIL